MSTLWFRVPEETWRKRRDAQLARWLREEVTPFCPFWRDRLGPKRIDLDGVDVVTEEVLASAGGPGNPALLLSPTERQFKSHARTRRLIQAASVANGSVDDRRNAVWRWYKPVHVHEAGVTQVLAIAYTRSDLDRLHLAGARLAQVLGWTAHDPVVNLVPAGPSLNFWGIYHAALASRITALHPRSADTDVMTALRRGLAMLPATILTVPVNDVETLITDATHLGVAVPNLRMICPVGPPPGNDTKARLTEAAATWAGHPVAIQSVWGPAAGRVLYGEAAGSPDDPPGTNRGLITYPDLEVLERRDATTWTMDAAGHGDDAGELVTTSLGWNGTAVIRLATGVRIGRITTAKHPRTGATVPRILGPVQEAAWQPRVKAPDGWRRVDLRGLDVHAEATKQGITGANVAVVGDTLTLRVLQAERSREVDAVAAKLRDHTGVAPTIVTVPDTEGNRDRD